MRTRAKGIPKSAVGNSRLTDFTELREVVLYHIHAVARLPAVGLAPRSANQSLAAFSG